MCEACKPPGIGIVGAAAGRRAQRAHDARVAADAVRAYQSGSAQPRLTATEVARRVLAGVGVVVALSMMNFLLHALLVTLATVFILLCSAGIVMAARRHRKRQRTVRLAPLPAAPARTVVTSVTVQPIEAPRKVALSASELEGGKVRRGRKDRDGPGR